MVRHNGYRGDPQGCVMLGLRHGMYCVGCCWTLMALLLVGGVMNMRAWLVSSSSRQVGGYSQSLSGRAELPGQHLLLTQSGNPDRFEECPLSGE